MTVTDSEVGTASRPQLGDLTWSWPDAAASWRRRRATFLEQVADALGSVLAAGEAAAPSSTPALLTTIGALPASDLERFLLAPRVSNLVLWPSTNRAAVLTELDRLVRLELADLGHGASTTDGWTADGRSEIVAGDRRRQRRVTGLPVVDLLSPHARRIDISARRATIDVRRPRMSAASQTALRAQLDGAAGIVARTGEVLEFVNLFTTTIVAQLDDEDPRFSSGTTWQFLGQVMLANLLPQRASTAEMSEALIHESIHGYLSMCEHQAAWVHDPMLHEPHTTVRSPWTGRLLQVRTYLQACFVWFGLVHYWRRALEAGLVEQEARRLLRRATDGFLRTGLTDALGPDTAGFDNGTLSLVDTMQERVVETALR